MQRLRSLRSVLFIASFIAAALACGVTQASAATRTWTGSGANDNWTTGANWQGGVAPVGLDTLVFPAGANRTTNVNNYAAGTLFQSITFQGSYAVTGNGVALQYGLTLNGASSTNVVFSPDIIFANGAAPFTFDVASGNSLITGGTMSGSRGFNKIGTGALTMQGAGANTFTGVAQVNAGTVFLLQSGVAIPAGLVIGDAPGGVLDTVVVEATNQFAGPVTIVGSGQLLLDNVSHDVTALTIAGNITTGTGTLTLKSDVLANGLGSIDGHLSLGGATRTVHTPDAGVLQLTINADIGDGGPSSGIIKTGPGAMTLKGASTYTGTTTVQDGWLRVNGAQALGTAAAGTILLGTSVLAIDGSVASEPLTVATDGTGIPVTCNNTGVKVWGGTVVLNGPTRIDLANACDLHFGGPIIGTGSIDARFLTGTIHFDVPNAYQGGTRLTSISGTNALRLHAIGAIPATSVVEVGLGTTLDVNGFNQTISGLIGGGNTLLGGAALTINQASGALTYAGAISGNGSLVKKGAGSWRLDRASTYGGPTTLQAGNLIVRGSITSPVTMQGGTLSGNGSTGAIAGPSGTIDLFFDDQPRTLTAAAVTLNPSLTLSAHVHGAGALASRLRVNGAVTLNDAPLQLTLGPGFQPGAAGELTLIENTTIDNVVGTFAGIPQGSTITVGDVKFQIDYFGGDGNDVTLSPIATTYYLSEGATGAFFDTDILLVNPNKTPAAITIRFLPENGQTVTMTDTLAPMSRKTLRVDDIPALSATAFSTIVTSDQALPIVVERTMQWGDGAYGAHTDKATTGTAPTWYFAEGAQGFFWTYLLLTNPHDAANVATVEYLRENEPPVVRTYPLDPHARFTVNLFEEEEVRNRAFGMTVTFDQPGTAERSMYFGMDPLFTGGHESAGETTPSTTWFLAEGATGTFFQTYVLLANPFDTPTQATVRFLPSDGGTPVTKTYDLAPKRRLTLDIAAQDASLVSANVATEVTAADPIIVERAQYWPYAVWYESHNSFGVTSLGTRWGLAEGRVGGPEAAQTYILLANPGTQTTNVKITFLRENGAPIVKTFAVAAASRFNVRVGPDTEVPELVNERFGAIVESDRDIAVERALYWDANGVTWAAGTSATATKLPPPPQIPD